jgi:hypothetical protein
MKLDIEQVSNSDQEIASIQTRPKEMNVLSMILDDSNFKDPYQMPIELRVSYNTESDSSILSNK